MSSSSGPSGNRVFAPAIFFIAFREALEASLVIGILSGMLERVVDVQRPNGAGPDLQGRQLIKKLRRYIFLGAGIGLLIAFAIGAAFLAVFYTQTTDLYGRSEELWEGIFNLIAVCLITPMSLAILNADRSRAKWRKKLSKAFAGVQASRRELHIAVTTVESRTSQRRHRNNHEQAAMMTTQDSDAPLRGMSHIDKSVPRNPQIDDEVTWIQREEDARNAAQARNVGEVRNSQFDDDDEEGSSMAEQQSFPSSRFKMLLDVIRRPFAGEARGATAIFIIPLITTLREGLEGVVFIGGVSLGLPATSIPLPAVVGIAVGLFCGFVVFKLGSFSKVRFFLVFSTCLLLIIAAGMASRSVYYLQFYRYVQKVGDAAAESGSGPGSYDALNYVWHFDCCNPEDKSNGGSGWAILNSIFGWNNTATVGSILAYIFYWLAVISWLLYSHFRERYLIRKSKAAKAERQRQRNAAASAAGAGSSTPKDSASSPESSPRQESSRQEKTSPVREAEASSS